MQADSFAKDVSYKGYITGFVSSLFLTLFAFWLVNDYTGASMPWLSKQTLILLLAVLALLQFGVQMVFFLHLGASGKPRWKLLVFWFMILTVFILVGGSIWIMDNLNYNMGMTPQETKVYMGEHEGF